MTQGRVVSLQLSKGRRQPMTQVQEAVAISDFGLEGDRHAMKGNTRQVLLADSRVPDLNPPGYRLLGQWQSCTWPDLGESSEYNGVRVFASEPSP